MTRDTDPKTHLANDGVRVMCGRIIRGDLKRRITDDRAIVTCQRCILSDIIRREKSA